MLLENLINRGSTSVLEKVLSFTQARHEVLANNVSNFDTPGYKMKDLSVQEFTSALELAVARRDSGGADAPLQMADTRHLRWDQQGHLQAQPSLSEDTNILFHDGNNRSVEKQMSEMSKNALLHNVTVELLREQYNVLQTAIRGRL
jgi:flagellar basal-body rod protein FlgB